MFISTMAYPSFVSQPVQQRFGNIHNTRTGSPSGYPRVITEEQDSGVWKSVWQEFLIFKPQYSVLAPCKRAMVGFPGIETVDGNNAEHDQYSSSKQQCHNWLDIRSSRICELPKIVIDKGVLVLIFYTRWATAQFGSWAVEGLHVNVSFSSLRNTVSDRFTHKDHTKTQIVRN